MWCIDFELRWMPELPPRGVAEGRIPIWTTIYGPRDLASDLRDTLQSLDLFLQDPIYALKDVPYFNPQRFCNDPNARTTDLKIQHPPPAPGPAYQDEPVVAANMLDSLTVETHLQETAGSTHLKTDLKR
ncbi:hypothetical protein IL306_013519 [Fusarium sp. DS 682]|nr:hypothetical protein IL306_013519 [Fusarium sp. DS 682]